MVVLSVPCKRLEQQPFSSLWQSLAGIDEKDARGVPIA